MIIAYPDPFDQGSDSLSKRLCDHLRCKLWLENLAARQCRNMWPVPYCPTSLSLCLLTVKMLTSLCSQPSQLCSWASTPSLCTVFFALLAFQPAHHGLCSYHNSSFLTQVENPYPSYTATLWGECLPHFLQIVQKSVHHVCRSDTGTES